MSSGRKFVLGTVLALSVAMGGLAGAAYYTLATTQDRLTEGRQRLAMLKERLQHGEQESDDPQPPTAEQSWQLLDGPDVVSTLQRLQQLGDETGVVFDEQKALKTVGKGKQSYSLTGRAAPDALCALIAAIERDERLMIVETGRFAPAGREQIGFDLGLATYHEEGGQ